MIEAEAPERPDPAIPSARLLGAAPIVPVRRVAKTVAFYTEVLRFDLADRNTDCTYAYLRRGGAGVILLDLGDAQALRAVADYFSAYFWVDGVASYYAEIAPQLQRLGERRVRPLFEKPDGRREFHVRDPDGFLLFFGEALGR
ncbi:MAG: VOC family protein [Pikeienuella sp.]